MARSARSICSLIVVTVLILATGGCSSGSGGSDGTGGSGQETTVAPAGSSSGGGGDGTTPADPGGDEAACELDSNQVSGSSTVTWDDGDVPPELTMTFVDNENKLDPPSLTVKVGERFAIAHGPGQDLRSVKIGCAGGQTMPISAVAGFVITSPGTFTITDEAADDYAGAMVGSVTVE